MKTGTIKRLMDKGFGFIGVEGEKDYFFHMNEVENARFEELNEGDQVQFEVAEGPKGLSAVKVTRI
ncbi:MAG: cold shock domain-containing protein [Candidatus Pacebacteria bacterium]|nr:cold shock domain-containing protein [Candidatus Paceibacterota bacterium]